MDKTMTTLTAEYIAQKIKSGFNQLSSEDKVAVLTDLYYSLYDAEKDEFLKETENN